MKKLIISCLAFLFLCSATVKAQGLLDKIDRTLDKADRASRTADRTKNTGSKLTGFLKKKEDKTVKDDKAEMQTIIQISGIGLSGLKKLNESIQTCKSVSETSMKYNSTASLITVAHTGSTEDLFDLLSKSSQEVFNDKNIDELEKGTIAVNLKKK